MVVSLVDFYKEHSTAEFTRLRKFALKKDSEMRLLVSIVTPNVLMTFDQLAESMYQWVNRYIIPEHECRRTGSHYN